MKHVTVYREPGRYAGWPANYGIWSWGDEIVVGFTVGYMSREGGGFHPRDTSRPFTAMQARSLDGGETWSVAPTPCRPPGGVALSAAEHSEVGRRTKPLGPGDFETNEGGILFTHPDFALMCARTGLSAGSQSWFYTSIDRCRSWQGPFALSDYGTLGVAARTDYIVWGPEECTLFLTCAKSDGREGRVFCARTTNGGRSFPFQAWIGPEPSGFAIMPASVRLADDTVLVAVRCRERGETRESERNWIDAYISEDRGNSWVYLGRPVPDTGRGGNPPALTLLRDGRLCMTYGYRDRPSGIRAVLSADGGRTWGPEINLRADGGDHDIGYPRTVQRADGKLVTVYYYNDHPAGERYIAATVWEAP